MQKLRVKITLYQVKIKRREKSAQNFLPTTNHTNKSNGLRVTGKKLQHPSHGVIRAANGAWSFCES